MRRIVHRACIAVALGIALAAATAAGARSTSDSSAYRFIGRPVLLYGDNEYDLIWRLNRDLPRSANRRAKAQALLNGKSSIGVRGGGRRQRCFEAHWERPSDFSGAPRIGSLYRIALRIPGANTLKTRVRLSRHTKGYSSFKANAPRDPKARALHCFG